MSNFCFLCTSTKLGKNKFRLLTTNSSSSNQPLYKILEKFVGHSLDASVITNSIVCFECFQKFEDYDEMCTKAAIVAQELMDLYKTAQEKIDSKLVFDNCIKIKCNSCKKQFKTISELRNHSHKNENEEEKVEQEELKEEVDIKEEVSWHGSENESNSDEEYIPSSSTILETPDSPPPKLKVRPGFKSLKIQETFDCKICGEKMISKTSWIKHMESHDGSRKACNLCTKTFKTNSALEIHVSSVHNGNNPNECSICHKVFNQKGSLARHYPIHTGETNYLCVRCGKQFIHYSSFHMHQLAHDDIREKKCEVCGFSLRSNSHLKRHMRIHTGDKPYECPVCQQKFAQRYNMTTHLKSHNSGNRESKSSYSCQICSLKFPRKTKLKAHMNEVHDIVGDITDLYAGESYMEEDCKDLTTADDSYGLMNF